MTRRLLYLNGLAVLAVIGFHSAGWGYTAMFWWTHRYSAFEPPYFGQLYSLPYFGLRLLEQLAVFGVPAFLFVSGYFVSFAVSKTSGTANWGFLRSRLIYLIIPYLLWTTVTVVVNIAQGATYTAAGILGAYAFGRETPGFYFVPMLCQYYLLSPLLVRLGRHHGQLLLIASALIQFVARSLSVSGLVTADPLVGDLADVIAPAWFFPGNLFWFTFGIVAGAQPQALKALVARFRASLLVGVLLLVPVGMLEWEALYRASGQPWVATRVTLVDDLYAGLFILSYLSLERARFPAARVINELGSKSFGIYLVHSLALTGVARLIYHFTPGLLAYEILLQPILYSAGLGLPLLLMALVKRSPARRFYAYQFG